MAKGFGTTFWRKNDDDPAVFEQIAGVRNYGALDASADTYEETEVDQAEPYKTYGKGLIDSGEFELTLSWKSAADAAAAYKALLADLEADGNRSYEVRLPEKAGKVTFELTAMVTGVGSEFPADNAITRKVKMKLSGKVVEGVWV